MASDNLIHGNLAGMQTTYDLIRKIYAQYRLRISGPVVLRGKDQMPVSPLSLSTSYTQQKLHIKDPGSDFRWARICKFTNMDIEWGNEEEWWGIWKAVLNMPAVRLHTVFLRVGAFLYKTSV